MDTPDENGYQGALVRRVCREGWKGCAVDLLHSYELALPSLISVMTAMKVVIPGKVDQ